MKKSSVFTRMRKRKKRTDLCEEFSKLELSDEALETLAFIKQLKTIQREDEQSIVKRLSQGKSKVEVHKRVTTEVETMRFECSNCQMKIYFIRKGCIFRRF